jgi:nitrogen regulatory protein PII
MAFKTPTTICENIVIGHSLSALAYSHINNYPIIVNRSLNTSPFDYCPPHLDLNMFGIENVATQINMPEGFLQLGVSKIDIEAAIVMQLTLAGQLLNSVPLANIKVGDQSLECFSNARKYCFSFKKLHVFSPDNISGLNIEKENITYKVYDNMNLKHFNNHDNIGYIKGDDNFVKEVFIYPSQRNGAKKTDMDLLCKSFLSKEQIDVFNFSGTMCRMKVTEMLKKKGLKGRKVATHKGREYSREISLETHSRTVSEEYSLSHSHQSEHIVVHSERFEMLIENMINNASATHSGLAKIRNLLKSEELLCS